MTDNNNVSTEVQNTAPAQSAITGEHKAKLIIMWVLFIFFGVISTAIFYFISKGKDAVFSEEVRKALNVALVGFILNIIVFSLKQFEVVYWLGSLLVSVYALGNAIVGIVSAIKLKSFKPFIYGPNWVK